MADLYCAVTSGDRARALEELRDLLAVTISNAAPQYIAPLARQLAEVMREIDALRPPDAEASASDDLAAKRAIRRTRASGQ